MTTSEATTTAAAAAPSASAAAPLPAAATAPPAAAAAPHAAAAPAGAAAGAAPAAPAGAAATTTTTALPPASQASFPPAPLFAPPPASSAAGAAVPGLTPGAAAAVSARGTPATLNLDDIFGDCFFTPEGDTVFLSDQPPSVRDALVGSGEAVPSSVASRPAAAAAPPAGGAAPAPPAAAGAAPPAYVPVAAAAGIASTNLDKPGAPALVMGAAAAAAAPATTLPPAPPVPGAPPRPTPVPFAAPPQRRHHLQYAAPAVPAVPAAPAPPPSHPMSDQARQAHAAAAAAAAAQKKRGRGGGAAGGAAAGGGGGARSTSGGRKTTDQQKDERRERNREHAKRSRIRKKFLLESLQQSVSLLKEENEKLRSAIRTHLGDEEADELLTKQSLEARGGGAAGGGGGSAAGKEGNPAGGLIASGSNDANKVLDDPDFSFIKALQTAQQNFVVTDPSLPDNPIVYATQGFLNLTGYTLDQVLGRNCRFLQGPETDPKAVEKIRRSIEDGSDMSVCLLNYRVDGTTFWNQFFIAALRDAGGNITNYVGVQCKVSDQYAANVCRRQEEADAAAEKAAAEEAGTVDEGGDVTMTEAGEAPATAALPAQG